MFLLFDNLTATVIGGTIILVISAISLGIQKHSTERVVIHAAKQGLLTTAEMLERDLHTAGSDLKEGEDMITGVGDDWIEVQYRLDPADPQPVKVKYQAVLSDTLVSGTDSVVVYTLKRYVDGVEMGSSPPYLSYVSFTLLDDNEQPVVQPANATMIRVRLRMALPFGWQHQAYIRNLYWGTTFRPLALRKEN